MSEQSTAPVRRLSLPVMVGYGFGQVGEALTTVGFNTFLLYYYNQVLGVSGTVTGAALAISLVVDAAIDPMAGAISDRLKSKWGRRHPFMALAAVPLGICFFLMFNPMPGLGDLGLAVWLMIFTLLTRIALTFYQVPHLALGAEMAHDYNQRSQMYSFNFFFAAFGGAISTAAAYYFFFPTTPEYSPGLLNPHGYVNFSLGFACLMAIAILVCAYSTRKEIPYLPASGRDIPHFTVWRTLIETRDAFRNRSFRALFFGMALATLMLSMEGVLTPYMGPHFWGLRTEQLSIIPAFSFFGLLAGVVLMMPVTKLLDKKRMLIWGSFAGLFTSNFLVILRLLDFPWFPANDSPWVLILICAMAFVGGVLGPLIFGTLNAMFADIVDEHELETGHRREGIIFAARSFLIKAVSSMGVLLGGIVIDLIEFPRGAVAGTVEPDVLWNLGLFQAPLPSILVFVAIMLYSGYQLDRHRHAEIIRELAKRRENVAITNVVDSTAPIEKLA